MEAQRPEYAAASAAAQKAWNDVDLLNLEVRKLLQAGRHSSEVVDALSRSFINVRHGLQMIAGLANQNFTTATALDVVDEFARHLGIDADTSPPRPAGSERHPAGRGGRVEYSSSTAALRAVAGGVPAAADNEPAGEVSLHLLPPLTSRPAERPKPYRPRHSGG